MVIVRKQLSASLTYPETIAQGHSTTNVEVIPTQVQRLEPYVKGWEEQ